MRTKNNLDPAVPTRSAVSLASDEEGQHLGAPQCQLLVPAGHAGDSVQHQPHQHPTEP